MHILQYLKFNCSIIMSPMFMIFHALLLILSINSRLCFCKNSTSTVFCRDEDRDTLLEIKLSLSDPWNVLKSWESEGDCCKWRGISCDAASGHVVKLELLPHMNNEDPYDPYWEPSHNASEFSPHFLELKHLNHLDLSGINMFNATSTRIPKFIGSMEQLRYLNLSRMNFQGLVPHELGNLTNLEILDLTGSSFDDVKWFSSLVALKYLDISGANLRGTQYVLQVLSMIPSLSHLSLQGCGLHSIKLFSYGRLFNATFLTKLQYLDLSWNWIGGEVPSALGNMTGLKYLDISGNKFNSSIPIWFDSFESLVYLDLSRNEIGGHEVPSALGNMTGLKYLDISFNGFNSSITTWFDSFESLVYLDVSWNDIGGEVPSALGNMTGLKYLDISYNRFNSSIPIWFDNFESLVYLDLSSNGFKKIEGGLSHLIRGKCYLRYLYLDYMNQVEIGGNYSLATSSCGASKLETLHAEKTQFKGNLIDLLEHLTNLKTLILIGNSFSGPFPTQILETLTNLVELDLSHNRLEGTITEVHFANLSRLRYLNIGSNKFSIDLQSGWIPPFQLLSLLAWSCNFGSQIPKWIHTQREITMLDLSDANISGDISMILGCNTKLESLNLSHNNISGTIQKLPPSLRDLDLSYNLISGIMIGNASNSKMARLDIAHNQISGVISLDFKENLPGLSHLSLSDNHFSGSIPTSLCHWESLEALALSENHFSGTIPDCWDHSINSLKYIDLSSNKLTGNIPISLGKQTDLKSLHLNNNSLHGEIPYSLGYLQYLETLDLGDNNLSGKLPAWIGQNLTMLWALRLRQNHLTGDLPVEICTLSNLQILDVGVNDLKGHIPNCLGNMRRMTTSIKEYEFLFHIRNSTMVELKLTTFSFYGPLKQQVCWIDSKRFNAPQWIK